MPIRVRNWHCPVQRLLYTLDRDLDKFVRAIAPSEKYSPTLATPRAFHQTPPLPKCNHLCNLPKLKKTELRPESTPKLVLESEPECNVKTCCAQPDIVYNSIGHDYVCQSCGVCKHAGFEEVGDVIQYEQREHCAQLGSVYYCYNRNKHFKKILRDVTNMHIRIPKKLVHSMREKIKGPITVAKVRAYLRNHKLYHYYTSSNNIARVLGDQTHRIHLDSRAYNVMCAEADAVSIAFDRMREQGLIKRKNFVNASVLILHIATTKFNLPEIKKHLRLPRAPTAKRHLELLNQVYNFMG